ncbi:hypothetical protein F0562_008505 [Nyssa sinensis]|uniref:Agenet domain-containing protein n=1 Tax=Nyssa sinensis TaxID=561372 RepID=A0A5J5A8S3_9ASTE|nr:hypothetical protein F0562_008505 [Nyssa sinensis]
MAFRRGEEVEVWSKEDRFLGSFYAATVLAEVGRSHYIVQYKDLLKDEESGPPDRDCRCRRGPACATCRFRHLGLVCTKKLDAFDNDGWWV